MTDAELWPEIRRLLENLKPFLKHSDGCGALQPPYSYCSCGLYFAFHGLHAALLASQRPPTEEQEPLSVCGYCGSPLHVEGDVLHRVDCNRPVPREDDTPDD